MKESKIQSKVDKKVKGADPEILAALASREPFNTISLEEAKEMVAGGAEACIKYAISKFIESGGFK